MPHIAVYNYEWDYWQLYHKVTFDGPNKLILINAGETAIDVKNDIYSSWKEWVNLLGLSIHQDNPAYLYAMSAIGGEPTPTGFIGSTFFLQNGWKIKPAPGSYRLIISGNLYSEDGSNPFVAADVVAGQPNNITVNLVTSNIVDLVGGGGGDTCPTAAEIVAEMDANSTRLANIDYITTNTNVLVTNTLGGSPSSYDDLVSTVNNIDNTVTTIDTTTQDIQSTVNNIENEILTGGFPTLGQITDGVWNAALSAYTTSGSAGLIVSTILSQVSDTNTKSYEIKTIVDSLLILIDELLKYDRNRTRIDKTAYTLTVYDDDGVTPLRVFNLLDGTGNPSVTEVCERDPGAAPVEPTSVFAPEFGPEFE